MRASPAAGHSRGFVRTLRRGAPQQALGTGVRFCLYLSLLLSMSTSAHRGHAVWTDIDWTGESFEIVHRMHLADAIAISRYMGGTLPIEHLRSLALVVLYVEERFVLGSEEHPETLKTIGAEIEDDFLFVYQEWTNDLPAQFPEIDNRVLLDIEPDAQAFIKIQAPGLSEERERR